MDDCWIAFPLLSGLPGLAHRFVLRHPTLPVDAERAEVVERLSGWHRRQVRATGFAEERLCLAEQVHGAEVAVLESVPSGPVAGVDGLVTAVPGLALGIYVADCAAVYLVDPVARVCGLVHSGRKGSEQGIVAAALERMRACAGSRPQDVRVQVGPCIRPPAYEVDFAAQIRAAALAAGVRPEHYSDCGLCTSTDLRRYYSYRMEKGRTGRMLALLGLQP